MTSISTQLTRVPVELSGDWTGPWNRDVWEGTVSCGESFVILLLVRFHSDLLWAKSLPSKENSLDLKFDMLPISKTEPRFQFIFSSGTGAFIQGVTAELADREHIPSIKAPQMFNTAVVVPFTRVDLVEHLDFSFVCFAKADVVVRRRYVWGLKPRLLGDLQPPWHEILAKGRNGAAHLE